MTPPFNDRPELTSYALGELPADQAAELHALLAKTPGSATELEQIEAVTDALRHGAPIAQDRLTPEQRHAVLRPSHLPRRMQPMMPRPPAVRRHSHRPLFATVARMAALIAVTGLAFLAGKHFADANATSLAGTDPGAYPAPAPAPVPATKPETKIAAVVPPAHAETIQQPSPALPEQPPEAAAAQEPLVTTVQPADVRAPRANTVSAQPATPAPLFASVQEGTKTAEAKIPDSNNLPGFGFTTPASSDAFTSVSKRALDQFNLRPAKIMPAPPKPAGPQFASPAPANLTQAARESTASKARPELYIHSWKAEIASCPWNEANRLLRVVVQLPADQPAATSGAAYPLKITFDPHTVREYRRLCERHLPAAEMRSAGVHIVWYEFQPNGNPDAVRDSGRTIATVTLPNGRFTSQAIGPFDSSKLQVLDRGLSWKSAREDFVFESSIVGFGMLLRGAEHTGNLNHAMVLTLAEMGKGQDTSGERTRFIRLVQTARKAAGL